MAALGELVSTTTHEFNNVLTTIINYAKLGLRHKDEASRDKALTKILAAAQRAEKITNGVLGMARNRGARPRADRSRHAGRAIARAARARDAEVSRRRSNCTSNRRRPRWCAATKFSKCC